MKFKVPFLARTNFAALFKLLPSNQQLLLAANHAQALTDAVVAASNAKSFFEKRGMEGTYWDADFSPDVPLVRETRPRSEPLKDPTDSSKRLGLTH